MTEKKTVKKKAPVKTEGPRKSVPKKKTVSVAGKSLGTRGKSFVGIVVSDKMARTVSVEWSRRLYVPKYERYLIRKSSVKAHNPEEINAKTGDKVRIVETRPISKTKKFIVTEIMQ